MNPNDLPAGSLIPPLPPLPPPDPWRLAAEWEGRCRIEKRRADDAEAGLRAVVKLFTKRDDSSEYFYRKFAAAKDAT